MAQCKFVIVDWIIAIETLTLNETVEIHGTSTCILRFWAFTGIKYLSNDLAIHCNTLIFVYCNITIIYFTVTLTLKTVGAFYCIFYEMIVYTLYIGSPMVCDLIGFFSNELCVFYPRALAREYKTHYELDKNHITSQTMGYSLYHILTTSYLILSSSFRSPITPECQSPLL
jgi:hypothetical protein